MRSLTKRGFTLIELLVVIAIIAILASILFPVFSKAREKARQTTCTSQLRQLGTALQMYAQDNQNRYPGAGTANASWDSAINGYVGSQKMFFCPSDAGNDTDQPVSYGYNGLLIRVDATGVNEAQVRVPTEVGAFCDAAPDKTFGNGGLVNGGALLDPQYWNVNPENRHARGLIIAYTDGHAKYIPQGIQAKDLSNPVTRAFYMAGALGLLDNPSGGIEAPVTYPATNATALTIGGDFCTRPILLAAAEAWKKHASAPYYTRGFLGQYNMTGMAKIGGGLNPNQISVVGCGDGNVPATNGTAIALDAVVVIVNKNCKINWPAAWHANPAGKVNLPISTQNKFGTFWANSAQIAQMFSGESGSTATAYVGYTYDNLSGSRAFFTNGRFWNGTTLTISDYALTVADDWEMVDKVAADPYGIGYCSAAMADIERVSILALGDGTDANTKRFPNWNDKYRWYTTDGPGGKGVKGGWGMTRTLYVQNGYLANWFVNGWLKTGGTGRAAMLNGPLFKVSYFKLTGE